MLAAGRSPYQGRRQNGRPRWVSSPSTGAAPSGPSFVGLGRVYVEDPEFRARYEAVAPGLSEYLAEAMRVFAEREL